MKGKRFASSKKIIAQFINGKPSQKLSLTVMEHDSLERANMSYTHHRDESCRRAAHRYHRHHFSSSERFRLHLRTTTEDSLSASELEAHVNPCQTVLA